MKTQLDMDKIARGLRAERRGKVSVAGGYFRAMQLLAENWLDRGCRPWHLGTNP